VRAPASFFAWLCAPSKPGGQLSRYLERYVALRPALRRAFPRCAADPAPLLRHLRAQRPPDLDAVWYSGDPVTPAALREPVPQRTGVNVVGYFRAEFGIGEAGRSLATALRTAGVPHALLDFSSGSLNRNADTSIERFDTAPPYGISILCANPDQFAYFDHHATATAFGDGRYRIGAWWFELPDLPEAWLGGFTRVDEVWVGSRFVEAAVARVSTVPVTYMPPIVEPRATAPVSRAEFGLADDDLAFLLVFDFNSVVERKNPAGAVAAFRRAFPPGRARLLIKTINAPLHPEAFARLRDVIGDDARIRLIDEYYDRDRIARLMRACDAYVSLHRAEGFGLTIAEAMLYGKPVVVTGWSGNLDFTTQENSFLVDARLVRIDRAYGPYYAGGLWAEPDLDAAAAAMRTIAEQPHEAARRAERGRLDVRLLYSRGRVSSLMRARIDALAAMGKGRT
jgi:glycosyltransferase involved in cell wall biosynthesis